MLLLGLLFVLGAAALTVAAAYDGAAPATVDVFGNTVDTTVAGLFLAGALAMFLLLVGLWLIKASMGRSRRKRADRKEAKVRHRDSVAQLEEERAELRSENERLSAQLSHHRASAADTRAAPSQDTAVMRDPGGRGTDPGSATGQHSVGSQQGNGLATDSEPRHRDRI